MKVLAAEGSESSRCQTLTSHKFSWPSHRRYLKVGSISQISHVACVCAEMSQKSIGCFEMDVNMNLCAISPSSFGCLWSVAALKRHERIFNLSRIFFLLVSFTVRGPVLLSHAARAWESKEKTMGCGDFTIRCVDTDQSGRLLTCSKGWGRNVVWNQASWLALIHAGGQREISTLCELVSYTTLRCGLVPSHCGLIIAGWKRHTTGQSGHFAAADDGRVFDTVFCTFLTASRGTSEQIKTDALIISEDLTWNDFSVELQRFGRLQQSASCKSNPFLFSARTRFFFFRKVGAERVKRFPLDGGAGRQVASAEEWRFALSLQLFVLRFSSGNLCFELGNKGSFW